MLSIFFVISVDEEGITTSASNVVSIFLTSLIPMILILLLLAALFSKRIRVHAERIDVSGISLLLDNPDDTFKKSMKNFLETKRTLFYINEKYDNFDETLDSYYETYQFIKKEMTLLDKNKDKELYDVCTETLKELNIFLTENQNNYRRWFNNVQKNDQILYLEGKEIKRYEINAHLMRINEIQKYYYDYERILNGFKKINSYFRNEISSNFNIDIKKWEKNLW